MYLFNEMVDHALDAKYGDDSAHRQVFRRLVVGNTRVHTMSTVEATGKWIAGLSDNKVKKVSYADFFEAVGDDGCYQS